jgi:hypothetical protein
MSALKEKAYDNRQVIEYLPSLMHLYAAFKPAHYDDIISPEAPDQSLVEEVRLVLKDLQVPNSDSFIIRKMNETGEIRYSYANQPMVVAQNFVILDESYFKKLSSSEFSKPVVALNIAMFLENKKAYSIAIACAVPALTTLISDLLVKGCDKLGNALDKKQSTPLHYLAKIFHGLSWYYSSSVIRTISNNNQINALNQSAQFFILSFAYKRLVNAGYGPLVISFYRKMGDNNPELRANLEIFIKSLETIMNQNRKIAQ